MWPTILATARPVFGWVFLRKYFPLSQTGSAIIACRANSFRAIFWALWLALQAIGIAEKDLTEQIADLYNVATALLTYQTLSVDEIEKLINKNVYPADKQDLKVEDDKGSALSAMGLKPKIVQ